MEMTLMTFHRRRYWIQISIQLVVFWSFQSIYWLTKNDQLFYDVFDWQIIGWNESRVSPVFRVPQFYFSEFEVALLSIEQPIWLLENYKDTFLEVSDTHSLLNRKSWHIFNQTSPLQFTHTILTD